MDSPYIDVWVAAHAATTPDAPAVQAGSVGLSYRELHERVQALRAALNAAGIGPGDHVLIMLPNSIAAVVAGLATQALTAVPVEVSRDLAPAALRHVVHRARPIAVFAEVRDLPRLDDAFATHRPTAAWVVTPDAIGGAAASLAGVPTMALGSDGRVHGATVTAAQMAEPTTRPARTPDDRALILFTSGSTGDPHGVIQTYRNIAANTRSIVTYLALTAADRALLTLPLHYCYGRSVLQTHLYVGGSVVMDNRFAFPAVVMDALATEGATGFAGVPLTFEILRRSVDVPSMRFDRLRYVTQAGGAMPEATIAWTRAAFAPAELFVMYGQTEATARLTYLPPDRAIDKAGSIGIPIPGVTIDIVDEAGSSLPAFAVGELVASGENITPGYLDEPEATSRILRDGRLWTGDLGYRDDEGYLFLQGRSKEIIKVGGHRLSPVEIEQVVASHPAVLEAAVVGAPDPLLGEVPVAIVVPRDPASPPTADELRAHCRLSLPLYAVPVRFESVERLPRNETGKLLRSALAGEARATG